METMTEELSAYISEEKPDLKKGNKKVIEGKKTIIRNIYKRKLEDLTWGDLEMVGYENPNLFVSEWIKRKGTFEGKQAVWIVAYVEDTK